MLVLSRRIVHGDDAQRRIVITVPQAGGLPDKEVWVELLQTSWNRVRIGITADAEFKIYREEIYRRVEAASEGSEPQTKEETSG